MEDVGIEIDVQRKTINDHEFELEIVVSHMVALDNMGNRASIIMVHDGERQVFWKPFDHVEDAKTVAKMLHYKLQLLNIKHEFGERYDPRLTGPQRRY